MMEKSNDFRVVGSICQHTDCNIAMDNYENVHGIEAFTCITISHTGNNSSLRLNKPSAVMSQQAAEMRTLPLISRNEKSAIIVYLDVCLWATQS